MITIFLRDGERVDLPEVFQVKSESRPDTISFCDDAGRPVWQFLKSDLIGWIVEPPWRASEQADGRETSWSTRRAGTARSLVDWRRTKVG